MLSNGRDSHKTPTSHGEALECFEGIIDEKINPYNVTNKHLFNEFYNKQNKCKNSKSIRKAMGTINGLFQRDGYSSDLDTVIIRTSHLIVKLYDSNLNVFHEYFKYFNG